MADIVLPTEMLAQASNEEKPPKNKAAQEMKRRQVESLTPERRSEIGKIGADARWAEHRAKKAEEARWAKKKGKKH